MKLNSLLIGSEDPRKLKDYYTKLFGAPTFEDGGYFGWRLGDAAVTFGPHDEVKGKNREPGRILWNLETEDVKGDFEKLRRAGAQVVKEPYNMGEGDGGEFWIATFSDPDNNYFQLMSPMPEASGSSSTISAGSTSRQAG
jgi:predicted enzyme related to lactoylglutathione lyase